ncbi:2-keto-4-pentenoate hydratase [Acuticoccus sp. I52.16.1]|uniref:2-keto-4-pentenoate hydratase n=1 Tax=Acuticoccus sp. I52.16.1 TaxID=2928472 RepID=UPI001FD24FEC|nr:hypothetical protein [Acuticoccus sp. I52.16.1]UOM34848.1 hypothetical protein MRB58_01135 [Acuticoccus sp. I52.16.1]
MRRLATVCGALLTAQLIIAQPFVADRAMAACVQDAAIDAFVGDFHSRTPTQALGVDASPADARCVQDALVGELTETLGPVIGYKAGLTSAGAQQHFGVDEPVMGTLLEKMMLDDGATVPAAFGARPLFEADLLLVVGDAGINDATTPEEVLAHISAVHPFIELPDLMLAEGQPMTGATITAMNVGARMGVVGEAIPADPSLIEALQAMTVRVTAADGEVLAEAPGASVLGNPLNSALWLMEKGVTFEPGQVISVGSIGPLLPPAKAKGMATVTYQGLPGDPAVTVHFEQ